jgi:hypothetical protein
MTRIISANDVFQPDDCGRTVDATGLTAAGAAAAGADGPDAAGQLPESGSHF